MEYHDLNEPEKALWVAFPSGQSVDLRAGDPSDDPGAAYKWSPERTVRAEVIAALLLGIQDPQPGRFPTLRLTGARIVGRLDLRGAVIDYPIICESCSFDEEIQLIECTAKSIRIVGSQIPGFIGARMRTQGILNLHYSTINGILRLDRAHIAGALSLLGTRIYTGAKRSLSGESLTVEGDMECNRGFTASGEVALTAANVAGQLTFNGAVLESKLRLGRLRAGELSLRTAQAMTHTLYLPQASVETLEDDPDTWPPEIRLNGFTYNAIRDPQVQPPVAQRLDWVSRDPYGYLPQPYEQLAAYYKRAGHDNDVRRVLLAKQRQRRGTLGPLGKGWGFLLDWTVGYGYAPWRAAIWLALLLAIGTTVFAINPPHALNGGPVPPFNAFIYTLDLLIPITTFGLRNAYGSAGATQWLAYALIAAGWILTTAVVAGVTRVLRGT
jgi:hypothetical protein